MKVPRSPLFIFGFPRSGTTLLRSILNAHSGVSLINEPEIISSLRRFGFSTNHHLTVTERGRFLSSYGNTFFGENHLSTLSAERIRAFLEHPVGLSFAECFEHLLPKPAPPVIWGDKSQALAFYLDDVKAMYPEFFAVSMVRDPRASILSLYRKRKLKSPAGQPALCLKNLKFFVYQSMLWCEWMKEADTAKERMPRHVYELRFEDFLSQPENLARQLCQLIDIPFEPGMLDKTRRQNDPITVSQQVRAHRLLTEDLDLARASAARELCPWATFVVQSVCASSMQWHRYSFSHTGLETWQKLLLKGLVLLVSRKTRQKVTQDVDRHRRIDQLSERRTLVPAVRRFTLKPAGRPRHA